MMPVTMGIRSPDSNCFVQRPRTSMTTASIVRTRSPRFTWRFFALTHLWVGGTTGPRRLSDGSFMDLVRFGAGAFSASWIAIFLVPFLDRRCECMSNFGTSGTRCQPSAPAVIARPTANGPPCTSPTKSERRDVCRSGNTEAVWPQRSPGRPCSQDPASTAAYVTQRLS